MAVNEHTLPKLQPETVRRRRREIEQAFMRTMQRLEQQHTGMLCDLRSRCPHEWQYHGDPSGNGDSFYECTNCGKLRTRSDDP